MRCGELWDDLTKHGDGGGGINGTAEALGPRRMRRLPPADIPRMSQREPGAGLASSHTVAGKGSMRSLQVCVAGSTVGTNPSSVLLHLLTYVGVGQTQPSGLLLGDSEGGWGPHPKLSRFQRSDDE